MPPAITEVVLVDDRLRLDDVAEGSVTFVRHRRKLVDELGVRRLFSFAHPLPTRPPWSSSFERHATRRQVRPERVPKRVPPDAAAKVGGSELRLVLVLPLDALVAEAKVGRGHYLDVTLSAAHGAEAARYRAVDEGVAQGDGT